MHKGSMSFRIFSNPLIIDHTMILFQLTFMAVHAMLSFIVWIEKGVAINSHQKISKMLMLNKVYSQCTVQRARCILWTLGLLLKIRYLIAHVLIGVLITYLASAFLPYFSIGHYRHGIAFPRSTWRVLMSALTKLHYWPMTYTSRIQLNRVTLLMVHVMILILQQMFFLKGYAELNNSSTQCLIAIF